MDGTARSRGHGCQVDSQRDPNPQSAAVLRLPALPRREGWGPGSAHLFIFQHRENHAFTGAAHLQTVVQRLSTENPEDPFLKTLFFVLADHEAVLFPVRPETVSSAKKP
jgi:hypothetical protein